MDQNDWGPRMTKNLFDASRQISMQFSGLTDTEIIKIIRMALLFNDKLHLMHVADSDDDDDGENISTRLGCCS